MNVKKDIEFKVGEDFERTYTIYSDARLTKWRGEWEEWRIYDKGEGVAHRSLAYVAVLKTEHAVPGDEGSQPFWSPMSGMDLSGCTCSIVAEGVFTELINATEPTTGKLPIVVPAASFASPPKSAHYYVEIKFPSGKRKFPMSGTAFFRQP